MLMRAACLCWGRQGGCQDSQLREQRVGRAAAEPGAVGVRVHWDEPARPLYAPGEWAAQSRAIEPMWRLKSKIEGFTRGKARRGFKSLFCHIAALQSSFPHIPSYILLAKLTLIQGFYTLMVSPAKNSIPWDIHMTPSFPLFRSLLLPFPWDQHWPPWVKASLAHPFESPCYIFLHSI